MYKVLAHAYERIIKKRSVLNITHMLVHWRNGTNCRSIINPSLLDDSWNAFEEFIANILSKLPWIWRLAYCWDCADNLQLWNSRLQYLSLYLCWHEFSLVLLSHLRKHISLFCHFSPFISPYEVLVCFRKFIRRRGQGCWDATTNK